MPERNNYAIIRLLPLASLLLVACSVHAPSGTTKRQTSPEWYSHQQLLYALSRYQIRGTFAYISSQQKIYARFNLQQTSAKCYRLILTNTLGSTEVNLNVQPGVAQLINNQGKSHISDDPEVMLHKLAGISIPLNALRQWIIGLPGDAADFTLDSRGYLHTMNYSHNGHSWTITYQGYHDDTVPALPSNLELSQGDNRIKLKIDTWIL